jgi:putative spermidine/putrescine transport system ATP-binding protein
MSFLTLTDVSKFYGPNCVVDKVNLSVEKGEFVTLLGPSGCGKTTTLQMIAGFADVTEGSITLDGKDITHTKPNTRGLGIVFQSYALFPHMTVEENVSFGLEMRKVAKPTRARQVADALVLVHLEDFAKRYPRELSGGQRQRVALARALIIEPPVLLLDEPLSNLDAKLREEMQFELRQIQRTVGTTTILVTHDQSEAMSISDRVVVMQSGKITQIDQPYALYENPQSRFISAFVGKANLLQGELVRQGAELSIIVNGVSFLCGETPLQAGSQAFLSLRPEKIQLTQLNQGLINGRIAARFFLGSQWLYRVETKAGTLQVVSINSDTAPLQENQETGLTWSSTSLRILP